MRVKNKITRVIIAMLFVTGHCVADEAVPKTPDISAKLDRLVENKMDDLVRETYRLDTYRHLPVQAIDSTHATPCTTGIKTVALANGPGS